MARKTTFFKGSLTERDGHAWHYDEDWGPVFHFGDKLPCCGCKLGVGANAATAVATTCIVCSTCYPFARQTRHEPEFSSF